MLPRGPFENPRSCPLCAYGMKQCSEKVVKTQDNHDDDDDDDKENTNKKYENEVENQK